MSVRKYQQKSSFPHPHIGALVFEVMTKKGMSKAELARRMQVTSSSLNGYFENSSLQFGILWNLGIALNYDFLTELCNYYPPQMVYNEQSKLVNELKDKTEKISDMEKEIKIYKLALGIKE